MNDKQKKKAEEFLKLHNDSKILILPNAWDVASAKIFELAGFKAIGTTSAGIAASLGYPDGQIIEFKEMAEVIKRIVKINLPISVDIEAGYGKIVDEVIETVKKVIEIGAIGINIEDGTGNPSSPLYEESFQVEKINAIRGLALSEGIPLVINARTDLYWLSIGKPKDRLRHAIQRGNTYREAGADCIFIPGALDEDTITKLVYEIDSPINILVSSFTPPISELEKLGVSRISVGSGPMRATLGLIRKIAKELLEIDSYDAILNGSISYSEVNKMFRD